MGGMDTSRPISPFFPFSFALLHYVPLPPNNNPSPVQGWRVSSPSQPHTKLSRALVVLGLLLRMPYGYSATACYIHSSTLPDVRYHTINEASSMGRGHAMPCLPSLAWAFIALDHRPAPAPAHHGLSQARFLSLSQVAPPRDASSATADDLPRLPFWV